MQILKPVAAIAVLWWLALAKPARAQTEDPVAEVVEAAAAAIAPSAAPAAPAAREHRPLTAKERWRLYWRETFWSPGALLGAAGPALGGQLFNEPEAWGQGMAGYSRRFANGFGRSAIEATFQAGGAALLGHEVRYIRSARSGFLPRTLHALAANFVTEDSCGGRVPNYSRIGAVFGADLIRSRWMPDGYGGVSRALRRSSIELSAGGAFHILQEFSPELKRLFRRKRAGSLPPISPHVSANETSLDGAAPRSAGPYYGSHR